jgi:hypothetical protein
MILAPNSRLLLLDSLKPPPGFHVDAAVGTTFTLSLDALLIPPAAWASHAVADRMDSVDPILMANTLRAFAERTMVFHEAGFAAPFAVGYESLAPLLDEMLFPVVVDDGCTFHPKVWVLRFRSDTGEQGLRVLIGSRNLTLDTTWDAIVRLDSAPGDEGVVDGSALADLLDSLPDRCSISVPPARRTLLDGLVADLRSTRFKLPHGVESAEILAWSRARPVTDLFPERCEHRLVISPFLGSDALQGLPRPDKSGRSVLVSRPSSLSEEVAKGFEPYTLQTDVTDIDDGTDARLGSDLHAKVFAFDDGERATVILGSANATSAAFGRNDEVVVRLHGDADKLGVLQIIGESGDDIDDDDRDLDLGMLLSPWSPGEEAEPDADDGRFFEKAIAAVALVGIDGNCVDNGGDSFALTLWLRNRPSVAPGIGVEYSLLGQTTPLADDFSQGQPVTLDLPLDAVTRLVQVRFADLDADPNRSVEDVTVVLIADFEPPPGRHVRALRSLLTDKSRFLRFLRFLLESSRDASAVGGGGDGGELPRLQRRRSSRGVLNEDGPILEQLLRLLAHAPSELRHLKAVIDEFSDDEDILPADFRELWSAIEPLIPANDGVLA